MSGGPRKGDLTTMPTAPDRTSWLRVTAIFLVGVSGAFLTGKAPAALAALRVDLDLTLFQAGLVVSMFTILTAGLGFLIGAFADQIGHYRAGLFGLSIAALAGAAGSQTDTPTMLIASRAAEGLGFVLLSVSMPPLMVRLTRPADRDKALGLWGAYVPAGSAIILLLGGFIIVEIGWRGLWLAISVSYLFFALLLTWARPAPGPKAPPRQPGEPSRLRAVLQTPGPLLLAAVFTCYSSLYLAVTAFVPLILVEQAGWALPSAAAAGAFVMATNVIGNVSAGFLLNRGIPRARLLQIASVTMALGAAVLFTEDLPLVVRLGGAVLFSAVGGIIPGSLFAGVPFHAPSPAHISTVNGMLLQGVSIGQFVGPATTAWIVALAGDWTAALAYTFPVAAICFVFAMMLGRLERRLTAVA